LCLHCCNNSTEGCWQPRYILRTSTIHEVAVFINLLPKAAKRVSIGFIGLPIVDLRHWKKYKLCKRSATEEWLDILAFIKTTI
jgi:hypothetical protein